MKNNNVIFSIARDGEMQLAVSVVNNTWELSKISEAGLF